MYHKIRKILCVFVLCLVSAPSYAVSPGGIVLIQHAWPAYSEFNKLSFFQQISHDGGPRSRYFWANHFSFKNGKVGYIGLQNRGGVHFFNYSIWNAVGWKSGQCRYFSHEGSGVQCDINVPWKMGHQYKLDVSKNKNLVTGTIIDLTNGTKTIVGVIEVPKTYGKFYNSVGFVEEYSQGNNQLSSCFVMGMQRSIFRNPIGDDTIKAKQSTYTYGNCNDPYVVQSSCDNNSCTNVVNDLKGIPSPHAPKVALVNKQNLSAQTLSNALKTVNLVVIRSQDGYWAPDIYFPQPGPLQWKSIFVDHRATYGSSLHVNNSVTKVNRGTQIMYMSDGERWKVINTR
ncbi:hypothetical protein ME1_01388 [Bartonella vinsonii subsp. arupensis OK-94-513]|uniref:Metalloprotease StcE beta-sandwich domain-containing protein n=1 Tax=Bartonella vinsonii subsp. arupensis OK-94-513 TaxID=1094562 RepID=J1JQ89_BARVI|nr:hypothetical protein ME1_01388 [Bartonella vinsonii subsp. arupensis OK-94-513]